MSSSFLRLPPAIRRQIWLKCAVLPGTSTAGPSKCYATVYSGDNDRLWDENAFKAPVESRDGISNTDRVLRAAQSALDTHTSASPTEKGRVLKELRLLINDQGFSPEGRSKIREKIDRKFESGDIVRSIQEALLSLDVAPGPVEHDFEDGSHHEVGGGLEDLVSPDPFTRYRAALEIFRALAIEYPQAPEQLFKGLSALKQLKHDCNLLRRRFTVKQGGSSVGRNHIHWINVQIAQDVGVTVKAQDPSRDKAEKNACAQLLRELHVRGFLGEIYYVPKTESYPGGEWPSGAALADWSYVQKNVRLPKDKSAYPMIELESTPGGDHQIVKVADLKSHVELACWRGDLDLQWDGRHYLRSPNFGYEISLEIPGVLSMSAVGEGKDRETAMAAAELHLLGKLHDDGSLQQFFKAPMTTRLPSPAEYPKAPTGLFHPATIPTGMNNLAQGLGLTLNVDGSSKVISGGQFAAYEIKVELSDVCAVSARGEGKTTEIAKQQAWTKVVADLHTNGTLLKLLAPDAADVLESEATTRLDKIDNAALQNNESLPSTGFADLTLADMQAEKNAKVEIYNFAAGLGLVPEFEMQASVTACTRRERLKKISAKPTPVVKVMVRLPTLNLQALGTGTSVRNAEVAAAVAFKREAESKISTEEMSQNATFRALSTETGRQFFDFLRSSGQPANVEVESEIVSTGGTNQNKVRLTVNGEIEQSATMNSKAEAETIAHLAAAVVIASKQPALLDGFAEALRKGKGKILRDVQPVKVSLKPSTLETMRHALVEARRSGLPDVKEELDIDDGSAGSSRRRRRGLNSQQRAALSRQLQSLSNTTNQEPTSDAHRNTGTDLPMTQYSSQVLKMISNSTYSIVIGATGSGKTTQVPQIVLDDAIQRGQGGFCDIICTQPRRLAASSVAQRVAAEREEALQQTVGYHVRHDARLPRTGASITYCTTGILLEQLKHDQDVLDRVSHLVLDEVHERDLQLDLLLILLKRAIKARQDAQKSVPKIILMSATMDAEIFSNYFATEANGAIVPCPSLSVPGRAFPVRKQYLQSILSEMQTAHGDELAGLIAQDGNSQDFIENERAFMLTGGSRTQATPSGIDWKRRQIAEYDDSEQSAVVERGEGLVPVALIAATIAHICTTTRDGAILVFLPGEQEILATKAMLLSKPIFGVNFPANQTYNILLLHSTVPPEEQKAVLEEAAPGCRKVILSTNIAETSITVPDVKYVVDSGKLREKRYDQSTRISRLQCTWEAKSNARQRAGRAGRVQEGHYYALYSEQRHDSLAASVLPELLRSDLQETCLSIKAQGFKEPLASYLGQAIQPPSATAVELAVQNLQAIEAFGENESLTTLGRMLSKLPLHPSLGKMVILGVIFQCLDPLLVLSLMSSENPLFVKPPEERHAASNAHRRFARDESDHMALLEAFNELRTVQNREGPTAAYHHARSNFLHFGVFRTVNSTAQQIEQVLAEADLIPKRALTYYARAQFGGEDLNKHSGSVDLIKCLLIAGFRPNMAVSSFAKARLLRTPAAQNVMIASSSLALQNVSDDKKSALYTYSMLAKSTDGKSIFMRHATAINPLMALLFGGKLRTEDFSTLHMDDWLPFKLMGKDKKFAVKLILEFRKALDRMFNGAFRSLSVDEGRSIANDPVCERVVDGIVTMLEQDAGSGQVESWVPASWTRRGERGV